ncbi:MAG: hypothetical protein MJY89_01350 [Bacteroidales bacterium]|nr:hypothetical protein [Bacteroidales bacterium]
MYIKFSEILLTIAEYARQEAIRTGWKGISADHLMLGILRHSANDACRILTKLGIDRADMKKYIDSRIFCEQAVPFDSAESIELTKAARGVLSMSAFEALKLGSDEVLPADLLSAISRTSGNASVEYLNSHNVSTANIASLSGLVEDDPPRTISPEEVSAVLGEQLSRIFNAPDKKKKILN